MRGRIVEQKPQSKSNGAAQHNTSAPSRSAEDEAIHFLEQLRPGGPWVLTAIVPDGDTETITVRDAVAVRKFVAAHNGKRNLYYSVNPTRTALSKKAAKTDIAAIEYALADLDPKEGESPEVAKARYLDALKAFELEPSAIIDSGNGMQVLWKLARPIDLSRYQSVREKSGHLVLAPKPW